MHPPSLPSGSPLYALTFSSAQSKEYICSEDDDGHTSPSVSASQYVTHELFYIHMRIQIVGNMDITTIKGIGRQYGKKLTDANITDIDDLRTMSVDRVAEATGISSQRLQEWQQRAYDLQVLTDIQGIGPTYSQRLHAQGITTPRELATADVCIADNMDVPKKRFKKWVQRARDMVEVGPEQPPIKKAVIAEAIGPDNASIHIHGDSATVTIKGTTHEQVPVFRGNGMDAIAQEHAIAVNVDSADHTHLWFNGQWHSNIPVKKEGLVDKIKRVLGIG